VNILDRLNAEVMFNLHILHSFSMWDSGYHMICKTYLDLI